MDNFTKALIKSNCIPKIIQLKNDGYSEEYIKGYIDAYIDGFTDGLTHGLEKSIEIIDKV